MSSEALRGLQKTQETPLPAGVHDTCEKANVSSRLVWVRNLGVILTLPCPYPPSSNNLHLLSAPNMPGIILRISRESVHLVLTTTPRGKHYFSFYFTAKPTEAQG